MADAGETLAPPGLVVRPDGLVIEAEHAGGRLPAPGVPQARLDSEPSITDEAHEEKRAACGHGQAPERKDGRVVMETESHPDHRQRGEGEQAGKVPGVDVEPVET